MKMCGLKMKKILFNCVLQDTAGFKGLRTLEILFSSQIFPSHWNRIFKISELFSINPTNLHLMENYLPLSGTGFP